MKQREMKNYVILFLLVIGIQSFAQDNSDPVLMTIDDREVTKSEFESIYKKNNRDSVITKEDLDEYVELFVNFKLKVMEAEELGMDTLSKFTRELNGYRDQLARPYLVDKSVTDSLIREAYDRLQEEVSAAHILIKLPPSPSPEDTLKAYKEIMAIKTKVEESPEKFGEIAQAESEDPSAKTNKGELGYFTSLQMVYPFETAVFNAEVGEIAGPVRTRFGYHLVKVNDKRPARGEIRVAHILIRSEDSDPEDMKASSKKRADEIYAKVTGGDDFAEVAKKFSDDRSSASKGGELPVFGAGRMVDEFEEASFALTEPGQISEPIKTAYGWHIIKLIEKVEKKSFDDSKKELSSKISRDSRSDITKDTFIRKRKEEYNYQEYRKRLRPFYQALDTSYFTGNWEVPGALDDSEKVLFELAGMEYTQAQFGEFLVSKMRSSRAAINTELLINRSFENWVNSEIMDYEDSILENKYPEFKALMQEYRDGILLFDLTDQKVWSKAVKDTLGLEAFYEENKEDFMWKERAAYDVYTLEDEKTAAKVKKMLKKGKNQDDIRETINEDSELKVRMASALKEKGQDPLFDLIEWENPFDPAAPAGQLRAKLRMAVDVAILPWP